MTPSIVLKHPPKIGRFQMTIGLNTLNLGGIFTKCSTLSLKQDSFTKDPF